MNVSDQPSNASSSSGAAATVSSPATAIVVPVGGAPASIASVGAAEANAPSPPAVAFASFNAYLARRTAETQSVYNRVFFTGVVILVFSMGPAVLSFGIALLSPHDWVGNRIAWWCNFSFYVPLIVALWMLMSVPPNAVNIDDLQMKTTNDVCFKRTVVLLLGGGIVVTCAVAAVLTLTIFPFVSGLLVLPFGIWSLLIMLPIVTCQKLASSDDFPVNFVFVCAIVSILAAILPIGWVGLFNPLLFTHRAWDSFIPTDSAMSFVFSAAVKDVISLRVYHLAYVVSGCIMLVTFCRRAFDIWRGWVTGSRAISTLQLTFVASRLSMVVLGSCQFCFALSLLLSGEVVPGVDTLAVLLAGGVYLAPVCISFFVGDAASFLFISRRLLKNLDTRMEDGSYLAELTTLVIPDKDNEIYWIKRETRSPNEGMIRNMNKARQVDRAWWMPGRIAEMTTLESGHTRLTVEIGMAEDMNADWGAVFFDDRLTVLRNPAYERTSANAAAALDASSVNAWIASNFRNGTAQRLGGPLVGVSLQKELAPTSRDSLRQWTNANLRYLKSATLSSINIFHQSPRTAPAPPANAQGPNNGIFDLSVDLSGQPGEDIDFFVSHTWEDDGARKSEALANFANQFMRENGRPPLLWVDAACFNDRFRDMALASLPITISRCKKVLVLIGEKYLTRLWCLWELISLFIFNSPELARERIVICPLLEENSLEVRRRFREQLNDLTAEKILENCHCFDPNEEFRLRTILLHLGIDHLRTIVDAIKQLF